MKVLKSIFIVTLVAILASCSKQEFVNQIKDEPKNDPQKLFVRNGILIFDSEESFNQTLEKVNKMGVIERRDWEEKLGFKSFERFVSEIIDDQILYEERLVKDTTQELQILLKTGEIEEFSPLVKEYLIKGILEIVFDGNNEKVLKINSPMYPSLINKDGLVAIGNEILQYTKDKFKLIKSLEFDKVDQLMAIDNLVDNETFFVTKIHGREKVTIGNIFQYSAESFTTDRQKIVATETYQYYDRYHDNVHYEANYSLLIVNQKKGLFFWNNQFARTWVWGDFDVEAKDMPNERENLTFNYPDMNIDVKTITVLKRWFYKSDYLTSDNGGPQIFRSTWNFVRWGGPHGLGVRLIDHSRYERF